MKQQIFLCRHGETPWTLSGQHTGSTDVPLTEAGKQQALALGKRLQNTSFSAVFTSPLERSVETCKLAGFKHPHLEPDAVEWRYGKYEGMTSEEIHEDNPSWTIFTHGAPGGESPEQVYDRAGRLLKKLEAHGGTIALFSHGHFTRILAAHWLKLPPLDGRLFALSVASLSILGYEHSQKVLSLWNDTSHLSI